MQFLNVLLIHRINIRIFMELLNEMRFLAYSVKGDTSILFLPNRIVLQTLTFTSLVAFLILVR